MELIKYKSSEILAHIKHDLRQIPEGKSYGNTSVDTSISKEVNYSLINRGATAAEVNKYRKDFEKTIFKYNRKDLVHAVELCIQCPSDCPPEQEEAFFQTTFDWYCNTYLNGETASCFIAEVHRDEHKFVETPDGLKDISKSHLHIGYVPIVPAGEKHPGFKYRLNADALTKRKVLKEMHPSLQAELDRKGIQATVFRKKSGDGKAVALSVAQLKEITEKTGVVIDHTLTVDELATILSKNVELTKTVSTQIKDIADLQKLANQKDVQIESLKVEVNSKKAEPVIDKEKEQLRNQLQEKEAENQKLRAAANKIISQKEAELQTVKNTLVLKEQEVNHIKGQNIELQNEVTTLKEQIKNKDLEIQQSHEKIATLESEKSAIATTKKEHIWGVDSGWGSTSGWGNSQATKQHTIEEEKLW